MFKYGKDFRYKLYKVNLRFYIDEINWKKCIQHLSKRFP